MKEPMPDQKADENLETKDKALEDFLATFQQQVIAGQQKYGITLQAFNGRSAYNDGLQELVDLLQYNTQLSIELKILATFVRSILENGNVPPKLFDLVSAAVYSRILEEDEYISILSSFK